MTNTSTRRSALGATLAITAGLAVPALAGAAPDNADAELLRLCGDFRLNWTAAESGLDDDDTGPVTVLYEIMERLKGMNPATPNGLLEKAKLACFLLKCACPGNVSECGEKAVEFAYMTLGDIATGAGA